MSTDSSTLLAAYHQQLTADIAALLAGYGFRADGAMLSSPEGVTVASASGGTRVTFHDPNSSHGMGIADFPAGTSPGAIAAVASALHGQARVERNTAEHRAGGGALPGQDEAAARPIAVMHLSENAVRIDASRATPPEGIEDLLGDDLDSLSVTVARDGVWILAESRTGTPEYLHAWTAPHRRSEHDDD